MVTPYLYPHLGQDFISSCGISWDVLYRKRAVFKGYFGCFGILLDANLAERVGFEPTWGLAPPIRFRVGAVMTASVPLLSHFLDGEKPRIIYSTLNDFPALFLN